MKCSYCDNEKTRVVFVYICDDPECERQAKAKNWTFANHGRTTFKKTTKYTPAQERSWQDIKEATGFKE